MPSTLKIIGNQVFYGAQFTEQLVLPASVTHLGAHTFYRASLPALDLSKTVELIAINERCFEGLKLQKEIIDLNQSINLSNVGYAIFAEVTSKVTLPENMLTLLPGFFAGFKGEVVFPEGFHTVGASSFQWAAPKKGFELPKTVTTIGDWSFLNFILNDDFVLPTSLKTIGTNAFHNINVSSVDFTQSKDLTTIGASGFALAKVASGVFDLSKNTNLKNTGGAIFQDVSSLVILPENMLALPQGFFQAFKGDVTFPKGFHTIGGAGFQWAAPKNGTFEFPETLTTIGDWAFNATTFTKPLVLPTSLMSIGASGFWGASFPELVSLNPIPPVLGTNVFQGIDQANIPLYVIDKNARKSYKKAAQWKEFFNIIPINISDVALKYTHDNETFYPYNAVRVGEYYWIDNNFNHRAPSHQTGTGVENSFPMTQARLDKYLPKANLKASDYQIDINDFEKYYGIYYSRASMEYMQEYGKVYEKESNTPNSDWGLPTYNDYRQLFAMSPFTTGDVCLNQLDVQRALGAQTGDNPLAFDLKSDKGTQYDINWFKTSNNFYGFNLMPGGAILYRNDYWSNNTGSHAGLKGDVYHLFQAAGFMTQQSYSYIYDHIDTYNNYSEQWFNARWCRKLTDEELGYRLYINANKTDIIELGLDEEAPSGYAELPNGYLRGFYVQYMLGNPESKYTVEDLVKFTTCINDTTPQTEPTRMAFKDPFQKEASEVKFYPNPVENILNIESKEPVKAMQLYSLSTGNLVFQTSNVDGSVSLGHIPSGVYVVKFVTPSGVQSHKLMKK